MNRKTTQTSEEVRERLQDAFVRSKTFGRLRWLTDHTLLAMVLAVIVAASLVVVFLVGGEVIGPAEESFAKVNLSVQEVILGDSTGPANRITEPKTGQRIERQQRGQSPGLDSRRAVDTGPGGDLTSGDVDVANKFEGLKDIPQITLPPVPPGGGSPGSSSVAGIFEVDENVKSVVFVVDKSGSMGGNKLPRVKAELIYGINGLNEDQTFSVVFFDNVAWPIFESNGRAASGRKRPLKVLSATGGNKTKAAAWINSIGPGGGTNPYPAVEMALQTQPEKLYILSDGEFSPRYVHDITRLNRSAVIDCYGFGETIRTLVDIADQNGGIYATVK